MTQQSIWQLTVDLGYQTTVLSLFRDQALVDHQCVLATVDVPLINRLDGMIAHLARMTLKAGLKLQRAQALHIAAPVPVHAETGRLSSRERAFKEFARVDLEAWAKAKLRMKAYTHDSSSAALTGVRHLNPDREIEAVLRLDHPWCFSALPSSEELISTTLPKAVQTLSLSLPSHGSSELKSSATWQCVEIVKKAMAGEKHANRLFQTLGRNGLACVNTSLSALPKNIALTGEAMHDVVMRPWVLKHFEKLLDETGQGTEAWSDENAILWSAYGMMTSLNEVDSE